MQELLEHTLLPPSGPELGLAQKRVSLFGNSMRVTDYQPLSDAPAVVAEHGLKLDDLRLGDLQAIIELPTKVTFFNRIGDLAVLKNPDLPEDLKEMAQYAVTDFVELIYCFKQTATGRHAAETEVRFLFMTKEQIETLAAAQANDFPEQADEVLKDILILEPGQRQEIGKTADGQHWLPGVGFDVHLLNDKEDLKNHYRAVGREQATLTVDEHGRLNIEDHSKNGTEVFINPKTRSSDIDK